MEWFAALLLVAHYALITMLCVFGAHRIYVTLQSGKRYRCPQPSTEFASLPAICVQLPLYNEQYVAKRLIDAAAQLDYPKDRLHIQVLDDSTDNTAQIVSARVAYWQAKGVNVEHVRRENRSGYKAGALAAALTDAQGEYVAVFDADFVPKADMLRRLVHHFTDPKVGMVQAQWDFLNRSHSFLTRLQAMMLDAHFSIEQTARHGLGVFFNFNGTAGIWRKAAIEDAGGWQADTITEDLDLSYRAQLAGWRFVYAKHVRCMSELPQDMNAFKNQQHRWTKGGTEVMRKLLPTIWRAPIAMKVKLEATFHLASNLTHFLLLIDSLFLLIPAVVLRQNILPYPPIWVDVALFTFGAMSQMFFYLSGQLSLGRNFWQQLWLVPGLMAASIGLSRNNGRGVFEALLGQKSGFVRTPKQGDQTSALNYLKSLSSAGSGLELALGLAYTLAAIWCVFTEVWFALPFLVMFAFGFSYTGWLSIAQPKSA